MAKPQARLRRREKKNITSGIAHVNATFNNTKITITDAQGKGTTVMIFNVRTDVRFADNVFKIPYYQVHRNSGNDR